MKNNFIQRAITGIIFVGVLIGCILGGPISFSLLFALITALTIHEFGVIISKQPGRRDKQTYMYVGRRISVLWFCLFRSHAWTNRNTDSLLISYHIPACQSSLYLKEKESTEQLGVCMMSQIYIALSFAMLNVLAYHSIGNEGELSNYHVQYNPILPLSIFISHGLMIREHTVQVCYSESTACLNEYPLRNHGKVPLVEESSAL